ncbi:MAG: xanthine dehydrogenase family protein molybdopterin-binding subunit [Candidatus Sumerlaeaceae bacterium]|nr:xanthine dehydrogenase family protein molybdopterin-binding subunit [Candidatus Sumerlaeaceae bacterium]
MTEKTVRVGFSGDSKELKINPPDTSPPAWDLDSKLAVVGTNVPRVDGPDKVTGRAKYTYDINLPGMLYGRILRSPHAAAIVKSVDTAAAMKMPGVKALVFAFDESKIGEKKLRYAGDEILAIAADSPERADDAVRAVKIEYDPQPFVVDLDDAMKADAPIVNDGKSNVRGKNPRGDAAAVDAKLAGSSKKIEATFRTQVQTHSALETHGLVVAPDGDGIKVWASTQGVFSVRDGLSSNLGLKAEQVRVISTFVGGGFGAKFGPGVEGVLCTKLARQANAPVKLMLTRKEEHLAVGNRPNSLQKVKLGADSTGKLTAISATTFGTGGVGGGAGCTIPAIYNLNRDATYKAESDVFTNAGSSAAMRAPGHPQGIFAMEQSMDMLAYELGLDPLEFRMLNDDNPVRRAQFNLGAKEIGWPNRPKVAGGGKADGPLKRGMGVAGTLWYAGGGKDAKADVEIGKGGEVTVYQGAQDIGTGFKTVLAILVAEELGLKPEDITVRAADSRFPYGPGSGGSTTTPTVAPAVHAAAYAAKRKLFEALATTWQVKPDDISAKDGKVFVASDPSKSLPFKKACAALTADKVTGSADREANYDGYRGNTAGCQFAEVEVDTETGVVRVLRVVAVQDAGRIINKLCSESQISGGVIQGLSYALFEDRIMDKSAGKMVNANFMEYKIAGPKDCPEIKSIVLDVANGRNSVGAMGLGEAPVIPTAAAIANAIYNAIGVRIFELPMTPDKIIAALARKEGAKTA